MPWTIWVWFYFYFLSDLTQSWTDTILESSPVCITKALLAATSLLFYFWGYHSTEVPWRSLNNKHIPPLQDGGICKGDVPSWFTMCFQSLSMSALWIGKIHHCHSCYWKQTYSSHQRILATEREQSQMESNSEDNWKGRSPSASVLGTFFFWWKLIAFKGNFSVPHSGTHMPSLSPLLSLRTMETHELNG